MKRGKYQIETDAVKELARWKAHFANEVNVRAKEIAVASDSKGIVSLDHYRQAAKTAVRMLATKIEDSGKSNDRRDAA